MNNILKKITLKLSWILEELRWKLIKTVLPNTKYLSKQSFTIGITTFMDRYESCLKPLVKKLSLLFPECQIIIIANGHVKHNEQLRYISDITGFSKKFKNLELISFEDPKGLSFLWNTIIKKSVHEKILVLNDDLKIKSGFTGFIANSGILDSRVATINSSWSHYLISKEIIDMIGYFDEGFLEIGGEDDDYAARLAMHKIDVINFKTTAITSKIRGRRMKLKVNTYGKNMAFEKGGYSSYNTEYLNKKWVTSNKYFEGAFEVPNRKMKYWKLSQ